MPSQVTILIAVVAVMFSVIGGLSLLAHYYTLSGIKSKTVGDGQHGTARFATEGEIKKTYTHVPYEPEKWRRGQAIQSSEIQGKKRESEKCQMPLKNHTQNSAKVMGTRLAK